MDATRPVSIVILTYDNLDYTKDCLESLERTAPHCEVVVVDNASTDGTPAYLQQRESEKPQFKALLNKRNVGFAAGCNQGVSAARHGTVCLMNNDMIALDGWLEPLLETFQKGVGAVGAKLLFPDMTLQHCGIVFDFRQEPQPHFWPHHRFFGYPEEIEEANRLEFVPAVTAACLLTNKTIWSRIGGMDEGYLVANFEDVDFNLRIREAGLKVLYEPRSRLIHYWGKTVKKTGDAPDGPGQHFQHNFDRLMRRWYVQLANGMAGP